MGMRTVARALEWGQCGAVAACGRFLIAQPHLSSSCSGHMMLTTETCKLSPVINPTGQLQACPGSTWDPLWLTPSFLQPGSTLLACSCSSCLSWLPGAGMGSQAQMFSGSSVPSRHVQVVSRTFLPGPASASLPLSPPPHAPPPQWPLSCFSLQARGPCPTPRTPAGQAPFPRTPHLPSSSTGRDQRRPSTAQIWTLLVTSQHLVSGQKQFYWKPFTDGKDGAPAASLGHLLLFSCYAAPDLPPCGLGSTPAFPALHHIS